MRYTVQSGAGEFGSFRVMFATPEEALRSARDLMERGAAQVRIIDAQGRRTEVDRLGRDLRGHNLTDEQIGLIGGTADVLTAADTPAADLFYDRLFEIAPGVRPLFKSDLSKQKRKLLDTLASLLELANHPERFKALLSDLGRRHVAYGAQPEHYGPVGEALLHSLATLLGDRLTPDVEAAWTALYLDVAALMSEPSRASEFEDSAAARL